ncbi:MAG: phage head-tail connector protein [Oscillospiraceae bacterium]|jgi:hypothetical protein|nr:phage head-tail connector protein [Oscillospiraceae bacterium]
MNATEKLAMLKVLVDVKGDTQDLALTVYLALAGKKIINKAFPYDSTQTEVPSRYDFLQCEIAAYLWNKRGAEGETSHSENGVSRSYENADVPSSMLKEIVPYCGSIREVARE